MIIQGLIISANKYNRKKLPHTGYF